MSNLSTQRTLNRKHQCDLWLEERREARQNAQTIKFNRHVWSRDNKTHDYVLDYLRRVGFKRSVALRRAIETKFEGAYPNKFMDLRSTAYEEAHYLNKKGGVFLDAGAGMSPDCSIAIMEGFKKAYAVDLFPFLGHVAKDNGVNAIQGDIVQKLPIKNGTVDMIICQAVLPLMPSKDRRVFYRRARKLLKVGGVLSVYFCKLKNGYEFDIPTERKVAIESGFGLYNNYSNGFLLKRVH